MSRPVTLAFTVSTSTKRGRRSSTSADRIGNEVHPKKARKDTEGRRPGLGRAGRGRKEGRKARAGVLEEVIRGAAGHVGLAAARGGNMIV